MKRYFAIIYWIWVSQTHYDTRYQSKSIVPILSSLVRQLILDIGDDAMHFLMKFCQISVYIYIGAASGNWAPGTLPQVPSLQIFTSDNQSTNSSTEAGALTQSEIRAACADCGIEEIQESFKTVVCAYLASRCLLAVQYTICELPPPFSSHLFLLALTILGAWQGSRSGRRVKNFWISTATLITSAGLCLAAVLIPLDTTGQAIAKVTPTRFPD